MATLTTRCARACLCAALCLAACRGRGEQGNPPGPPGTPAGIVGRRLTPVANVVPLDCLPMDVSAATAKILCSSNSQGLFELDWPVNAAAPRVTRTWAKDVLGGAPGEARYGQNDVIHVGVYSKGLAKIDTTISFVTPADGLINADLLEIIVVASREEIWVAGVPGPFNGGAGGGVQILKDDRPTKTIPLASPDMATVRGWIEQPQRMSVFAATMAGILEIGWDGTISSRSTEGRFSSISRQPGGTSVGAVGTAVDRWDGQLFSPAFDLAYRPIPSGRDFAAPIAVSIDRDGNWFILFGDNLVSAMSAARSYLGAVDQTLGVPASSRRLLRLSDGARFLIGGQAGMALLGPA
jgi:hypothetical protein